MKLKKLKRLDICILIFIFIFYMLVPDYATAADNPSTSYPYGLNSLADNRFDAQQMLISEWKTWKDSFLSKSGSKRVLADNGVTTYSEDMGYGLLLSVYFNEKALFDELFSYVKSCADSNGLMNWKTNNGQITSVNSDTNADQNIALALIFADKMWGSDGSVNYVTEGTQMLSKIYQYDISGGQVKPGDALTEPRNPSYLAPASYEIFSVFDKSHNWNSVKLNAYTLIKKVQNSTTGLVPDWCNLTGAGQSYNGSHPDAFGYDATNLFFNMAVAYSWYGHADAKTICIKPSAFFKNIGAEKIVDGYKLTGTPTGSYHSDLFVSSAATLFMTGTDQQVATSFYKECIATKSNLCTGNTVRLLTLMYMTGNFQNLYNGGTQIIENDNSESENDTLAEDNDMENKETDESEAVPESDTEEEDMQITLKASNELGAVKLEWNGLEDISGYYIYKSTKSGAQGNTPETDFWISGTTYNDTKVKPGTTYYYIVVPVLEDQSLGDASNEVDATPNGMLPNTALNKPLGKSGTIILTIGNSMMKANGRAKAIDTLRGSSPVINSGRTFVPLNNIISEMGGKVTWNSREQKVTIIVSDNIIELWIGKTMISVNGIKRIIDAAPYLNNKSVPMLPLRHVMESLGCELTWENGTDQIVTIEYDFR